MATNQRGHFPYEGEIGVGQPVSILRLTDTPSYIPVGTPQVFCSFSIFRTSFWLTRSNQQGWVLFLKELTNTR
jgi:hypothetical protein